MPGGGSEWKKYKTEEAKIRDLREGGTVFCDVCECDPFELSQLISQHRMGIKMFLCPQCHKELALTLGGGQVVPYSQFV